MENSDTKYFGSFVERNFKLIKQTFSKAFKKAGIDITPEQWVIIDLLQKDDGVSQNDLATKSDKDAPTVSRIIDILERKNLIERRNVEGDRRKYHIFLRNEGKQVHEKLNPIVQNLRVQGWEDLSDEDYQTFLRIMNQVYKNFRKPRN